MDFYWYWPFARSEELEWAAQTARPGEHVTLQVIDRSVAPPAGTTERTTVLRDLPDVDRRVRGRARWLTSRATTYRQRAARRRAVLAAGSFDLVHLQYVNRFTDAWAALPHPLVMSVHDVVPHTTRLGDRAEHLILARLYRRPDALVVHHARLADRLRKDFAVPARRIHVVPHQVFPVPAPPTGPLPGPPRVLFFGALRSNKGLELLDEVLTDLPADARLTIAGRGDVALERSVIELAQRNPQVDAEIGFATLERKHELFRQAHLVVLPYTSFASQSGVLHDAYGHGRPVVVTDVGALGESVREDGTGLVVPPRDPGALARAVSTALLPDRWAEFSDNAQRVAVERSPQATGRRLREVYDEVLHRT